MEGFQNRKLLIATKHGKEQVIAPILEKNLGVICFTDNNIDTDVLGTFSGEVERKKSPYKTALEKCKMAMQITGCDLVLASEGSFGAHPVAFFSQANEELVVLLDQKNNQDFFGKTLTTDTNFSGALISSKEEARIFANQIGFPEHALIIKDQEQEFKKLVKGICSPKALEKALDSMLKKEGTVWIETDMRAMYNPTRMRVIAQATDNLIDRMKSVCPVCNHPGFWVVETLQGLPCSSCGLPTKSTKSHKYTCRNCQYTENRDFPHGKKNESPMFCNFCNP